MAIGDVRDYGVNRVKYIDGLLYRRKEETAMYDILRIIINVAVNNMTKAQIISELLGLLKEKVSRQDIEKLGEYIFGESLEMKKALSRDNMLSEGVSEKYVDCVIEEIKIFKNKIDITDEMRSQCGYDNMELADVLWCEYCEINDKAKYEEYENDLKKGLFVVAKAWNEPAEENVKSCMNFLKRIDSKSSTILLNVKEVRNDAKDIKKDVKNTDCKLDKMNTTIEEMNNRTQYMDSTLKEVHQLLIQNKEGQTADEQKDYDLGRQEDDLAVLSMANTSQQETSNTEEISTDEIKICLAASPNEFQQEIDSLKEFIEEQNQCQNAVHLKLQCYNGEMEQDIQQCTYCYILAGTKIEKWMQEKYELICGLNRNKSYEAECVQLRLFFKRVSDGAIAQDNNNSRQELENRYRKDFDRIPFYFSDVNRIKLDLLQKLRAKAPEVNFSIKSILQFQNNTDFEEACRKRDALQSQYGDAGDGFSTDKSPEEKKEMESLEEELKAQSEIVEKMEKDIWNNLSLLTDKLQNKSTMDVREVEAIEGVIEYGDYGKADSLLRSEEWNREIVDLEHSMKEKQEILRQFISSQRTLISNLKARGASNSLENEIIEVYERITELSKEWHIEYITLYEFAEFLLNQRKYKEGIKIGEELKCLYGLSDCASAEERVRLLKLLGDLYYGTKEYERGQINYREALDIFRSSSCENWELRAKTYNDLARLLWKTNQLGEAEKGLTINIESLSSLVKREPEKYEPVLAATYNYMGILANWRNELDKAIEYHYKVLEIRERLVGKGSSYNYRPIMDLTSTYNNLAFVYKKRGEYQKAKKYYEKAIDIRSRNEKLNPSAFRPALALVYSNYATVLNLSGDNEKAQKICEKAYMIRSDLAQKVPSYKVELANTLHEYGIILMDAGTHMYPQAKRYFEEAIEIRESLADEDEMTYELNLAETYSCYGKLLAKMGAFPLDKQCYRKAEQNMKRACEICDKYSTQNEGYNGDKISEIYQNFALFLNKHLKKYSDAELYYEKAIEGWRQLTKRCQQVFEPKFKEATEELDELKEKIDETV